MTEGILTLIESCHNNWEYTIRDDTGEKHIRYDEPPTVGKQFFAANEKGLYPYWLTTKVQGMRVSDDEILFRTLNSMYRLVIKR